MSDNFSENDVIEFFETLTKYFLKSIDNTNILINTGLSENNSNSVSIKNDIIKLTCQILSNVFFSLGEQFKSNKILLSKLFNYNPNCTAKIIKILSIFHRKINKLYEYDIYNKINFSNLLNEFVSIDFLKAENNFTHHFIKSNIKEKLSSMIETNEYNIEEFYDLVKIIIKDNFVVLLFVKENNTLFDYCTENNFFGLIKELLSLYRISYNEEIQIFTLRKGISKKKIIFILDIIIKILLYINKLYHIIGDKIKHSKENFNKNYLLNITEINKMIDNYANIITKELRTNSFDQLINLFTYEGLSNLTEENINKIFTQVKKTIYELFNDLDSVKVSLETENYLINNILLSIINKITEELEKSLKRIPKNKFFNSLTDRTSSMIDIILGRYTINQNTKTSIKNPLKLLKDNFSALNMNKI